MEIKGLVVWERFLGVLVYMGMCIYIYRDIYAYIRYMCICI